MKRVLITGGSGFLGARILQQGLGDAELCSLPRGFLAAAGEAEVTETIQKLQPAAIVHAAALSDTGYCAQHPEEAHRANVELPVWVAKAACASGAKLLAFSSDQVYAGITQPGPLPETLPLQPTNVYGRCKLEMEQRVLELCPDAVLLRASWMYDLPGYGLPIRGNLPLNLLRAALHGTSVTFSANDCRGVTYVRQVIANLAPALSLPGGVYNFGSSNTENMVHTAQQFAQELDIAVQIEAADWPRNLVMDGKKLEKAGIRFDTTQQGIRHCLRDYGLARGEKEKNGISKAKNMRCWVWPATARPKRNMWSTGSCTGSTVCGCGPPPCGTRWLPATARPSDGSPMWARKPDVRTKKL